MKKVVIIAAGLLSGCAAQHLAQMQAQARQDVAQCQAGIPSVVGNYVKRNQCIVAAGDRAGFTDPGQQLINATRMEVAEKMDAGKMTPAEANAQLAQVRYQVAQDAGADQARRARAAAMILGAMPQSQPYQLPLYQTPQRPMTNCTSTGMGSGIISTNCY